MVSIDTDQGTVDRWLAAGTWVEFAPGERCDRCASEGFYEVYKPKLHPPADWGADQKCETCQHWTDQLVPVCQSCNGTGLRRHPVTVPCPERWRCETHRITVAWATVEWGPLPVVSQRGNYPAESHVAVAPDGGVWLWTWDDNDFDGPDLVGQVPPDIDPASLIGQWARGGSIVPV